MVGLRLGDWDGTWGGALARWRDGPLGRGTQESFEAGKRRVGPSLGAMLAGLLRPMSANPLQYRPCCGASSVLTTLMSRSTNRLTAMPSPEIS